MREFDRIDRILNKLEILWKKYPDLRLGQLLENIRNKKDYKITNHIWNQEDYILEEKIDDFMKKY